MNDKQKQIEEMAKVIQGIMYYAPDEEDDRYRYLTQLDKQSAKEIAEALITVGYRKQSDTAREILKRITNYSLDYNYDLKLEVQKIAEDYGVEVEE